MLVTPPCGASSNIALWRAKIKPPVELVVGDLEGDSRRRFVVNFCNKCSLSAEMIEQAKKFDMIL